MCGFHGNTIKNKIGRVALAHRGPDHYGVYEDENIVLEHWRLSIIDLSVNGNQPMINEISHNQIIAYNGEVYNFEELKQKIKKVDFKSTTDTEVVLHLYDKYGLDFLKDLNGMFALAIYDKSKKRIILARDRFGIKPLYYGFDAQSNLFFCSELKALMLNRLIEPIIDVTAIQSLFHLLYIQQDRTPFKGINKLLPGHYLVYNYETKDYEIKKFYTFQFEETQLSEKGCIDKIEELLAASVKMHLVSDVPVGALLSGGVDSSLMVAMMSRFSSDVRTYSVGYGEGHLFDESRYSNFVARKYKTKHHHAILREGSIKALLDEICSGLNEPIGDTSFFLNYFIFGFVAESVKVCLSGLGGDELFGGYNRYLACKIVPGMRKMPIFLKDVMLSLIEYLPVSRHHKVGNKVRLVKKFMQDTDSNLGEAYSNFIDYFSNQKLSPVLAKNDFTNTVFKSYWDEQLVEEMNRIYKYDIENYMVNDLLALTDNMSMRHSLEARVPFLENNLVDFALSIPPRWKIKRFNLKHLLKQVAKRYLPDEVIFRRKQGFSSPISMFLSQPTLVNLGLELQRGDKAYAKILNKDLFLKMIENHHDGKNDFSLQLFTLAVYIKWMGQYY